MQYLSDQSRDRRRIADFSLDFDTIKRATKKVPHLHTQIGDIARRNLRQGAGNVFKSKPVQSFIKKHDTIRNRYRLGKAYLKYRKWLGDTYGKEKGMGMLKDQTQFVKNLMKKNQ